MHFRIFETFCHEQRALRLFIVVCVALAGARVGRSQEAQILEVENKVEAARTSAPWAPAKAGLPLAVGDRVRTGELSRAALRLSDLSMLRLDELTKIEILPPTRESAKPTLDLKSGATYFFSREKPRELEVRTPAATGGLRGTEFHIRVEANGRTWVTMFDGAVELTNPAGSLLLRNGEQAEIEVGKAPHKTAMLEASNIIQWCLYYPGVVNPKDLGLSAAEEGALKSSLDDYRAGDLLGALEHYPALSRSGSAGVCVYRGAVLLAVGQVNKAQASLAKAPKAHPGRIALEELIAAVKFQDRNSASEPTTAGEWLARSYYQQSRFDLEAALKAAQKAVELAPDFGYAWERLAELEFSFGRTPRALKDVERALELTPRNAQAHALQGFLLAAENRIGAARRSFDQAIALDGALGNAWLGRGLCSIRRGQDAEGRKDLQTAAVLEPNRSILRSYLGKAFSQVNNQQKAHSEFERAKELDAHDPTPWLYSAIQSKQENRYNQAIADLEKSIDLNDNRRVYRSHFLLDQDRSIRGTNLAAIYQDDGMTEQSVREAVRSVNADYTSAPAHLFLANSYDALRDPNRVLLRYETPWFNELLLSNLLSPVGGGPLSQFVSQQEYSKLFERDGFGISSVTDYFSYGKLIETGSQYGTFGNIAYSIDTQYQHGSGLGQVNAGLNRWETYGQFKLQLGPQDTLFFQTKLEKLGDGYPFQDYDPTQTGLKPGFVQDSKGNFVLDAKGNRIPTGVPNVAKLTYTAHETQDPGLLLLGMHHQWTPGNDTLILLSRLANRQVVTAQDTSQGIVLRDVSMALQPGALSNYSQAMPFADDAVIAALRQLSGRGGAVHDLKTGSFDFDYEAEFETYGAELQQILTFGPLTTLVGARYQSGAFRTKVTLSNFAQGTDPATALFFPDPPAKQNDIVNFERINVYAYETWHVTKWLSLTGGVVFDQLTYPDNFRNPPVNGRQARVGEMLPKAGFIAEPWKGGVLRGAYTQSISGSSFDQSVTLEPTQVAGFVQTYRSLISESLLGEVAGSKYDLYGLSFEQKLPTRTYLGVDYQTRIQQLTRTVGVFDAFDSGGLVLAALPSSLSVRDRYHEDVLTATVNQLVGRDLSLGVRYQFLRADLHEKTPAVHDAATVPGLSGAALNDLASNGERDQRSGLHTLTLAAFYNHPSGFFARAEANWYRQGNHDFTLHTVPASVGGADPVSVRTVDNGLAGDEFWQFNLYGGWRFYRNQCELSVGVLNLSDQDYRLYSLDPYEDLPRKRTFFARAKFTF